MSVLKRLPVYAAGAGFAGAIAIGAASNNWTGARLFLVTLGVGAFYVVTILVPWLIREQVAERALGTGVPIPAPGLSARAAPRVVAVTHGDGTTTIYREPVLVDLSDGALYGENSTEDDEGIVPSHATHGPAIVTESRRTVVATG